MSSIQPEEALSDQAFLNSSPAENDSTEPDHSVFLFIEEQNSTPLLDEVHPGIPWHGFCGSSTISPRSKKRLYCGRGWVCPRCAQRAFEYRQPILENTLNTLPSVYVTNTIAASDSSSLATSLDDLRRVRAGSQKGKQWTKLKDRYGIVGLLRKTEVTISESGWHPHLHTVFHLESGATEGDLQVAGTAINSRFLSSASRAGISAAEHSQHSQPVRQSLADSAALSTYHSKSLFHTGGRLGWSTPSHLPEEEFGSSTAGPGELWAAKAPLDENYRPYFNDVVMEAFDARAGNHEWLTAEVAQEKFHELEAASERLHIFDASNGWDDLAFQLD